jgi:hypothetical protein
MTSSSVRALSLCVALSLVAPSLPSLALAQPTASDLETARDLNKQGKELRAQGRLQEALEKFRAAHDLGRTPITGIELARTHVMLNQLIEAREVCLGIARVPVASDETERSAAARTEAAQLAEQLRPRIPSLLVRVTGVPPGKTAIITIDKALVPAGAVGQAHKVNPGVHEVVAKVEGGPESMAKVDVREGETKEVPLLVNAPADTGGGVGSGAGAGAGAGSGSVYGTPVDQKPPRNKLVAIGFTVAGTGIVIGAMSGLMASSKKSNLDALCNQNKQCGPDASDDLESARSWATVSTIAFAIGGVGLALGLYGLFSKDEKPVTTTGARVTPYVGPGAVGVHGAF